MVGIKKNDRRVSRTRSSLHEAFQQLIQEKGYEDVTIEEITERANLGRTTFYLHYRDKEDLLLEEFGDLVDDLFNEIAQFPLSTWKLDDNPPPGLKESSPTGPSILAPIQMIFQHAQENADLYRLVLHGEGMYRVAGRLREFIISAVQAYLQLKTEAESMRLEMQVPMEVFSNYFASALIGMVTWWLDRDSPYPAGDMAEMFQRLFLPGAQDVIEIQ